MAFFGFDKLTKLTFYQDILDKDQENAIIRTDVLVMALWRIVCMKKGIMLSYSKLWKMMVEKKINKTQLHDMANISTNAVAKMSKNKAVSLDTLGKICYVLDCDIGDIVEIVIEREDQDDT